MGVKINPNDINTHLNHSAQTPLLFAAAFGYDTIAKDLIAAGANINAPDIDQRTPLHFAAVQGYDTISKDLIAAGANINAPDIDQHTPLHFAAWFGRDTIVNDLLKAGANVSALTGPNAYYPNATALYMALRSTARPKNVENVVKILLEHGATGANENTLSEDRKNRFDRVIKRMEKEREKIAKAVYDTQQTIPQDIAKEISEFAY